VAYALAARSIGLPTRVAVGFLIPGTDQQRTVHGSDATAWPEVFLADLGWVPFAPTPKEGDAAKDEIKGENPLTEAQQAAANPPAAGSTPNAPRDPFKEQQKSNAATSRHRWTDAVRWLVALLVVGIGVCCTPILLKARRRRRRRRGEPDDRVVGAWHEALDQLAEAGIEPWQLTARELSHEAARFGTPASSAVEQLGGLASTVLYGAAGLDATAGDDAWTTCAMLRHTVRGALPLPRRLASVVTPRTLVRR
jgi:hypothetical protein